MDGEWTRSQTVTSSGAQRAQQPGLDSGAEKAGKSTSAAHSNPKPSTWRGSSGLSSHASQSEWWRGTAQGRSMLALAPAETPSDSQWLALRSRSQPDTTATTPSTATGAAPAPPPQASTPASSTSRRPKRDPIVAPSPESGGIPDPSSAYLLRASFLPRTLPAPRPMLVIIDLNGTLLFRPSRKNPARSVTRPHARAFLAYCARAFHVMIWSSARAANVARLCADLLPDRALRASLVAVWAREQFGLSPADFHARVMCYKRLSAVWADAAVAAHHPDAASGGRWDQGNTVLVDDTLEKARSEPYNAIQIPEFAGNTDESPPMLPQVHDYLNTLACQADISTYIRVHPFQPQVDPATAAAGEEDDDDDEEVPL